MTSDTNSVSCGKKMLEVIIYIADVVLVLVLAVMSRQLYLAIKHHTAPAYHSKLGHDVDVPSVTVCIPARNEQHALTDCLQRVLASTYEKLEIIVLDDVSADETSALIKSFASEGVRFVQGSPLPKGWLGKNHALQGLLEEASGSYILFLDVDTVLAPKAIENMVRYSLSHHASMVSVLPRREDGWRASVVASPLRYFWELLFLRRLSPGSASTAWLIRRDILLKRFDGFKAFKNSVQPEAKIAAEMTQTKEYKFLIGTESFGVAYEKKWRSQLMSSVRLLYPLLGKQIPLAFMAILDLILLLVPFFVLVTAALWPKTPTFLILFNTLLCAGFCVLYGLYAKRVWKKGWLLGAVGWPFIIIQEIVLVIASVLQYKRRTVKWKGRLIRPEVQS
jgi:glycosyltransferase involved in cell wall biosynthesis